MVLFRLISGFLHGRFGRAPKALEGSGGFRILQVLVLPPESPECEDRHTTHKSIPHHVFLGWLKNIIYIYI